jgi:spermidine/putrescine transport system permease protein
MQDAREQVRAQSGGEASPSRAILWFGQLTTRGELLRRGWRLAGVPVGWLMLFLVLPCAALVALAFARGEAYGQVEWTFTLENFRALLGYTSFQWESAMLRIMGMSLFLATGTTALCLLLAYPLAFFIATRRSSLRYFLLAVLMVPFCTNLVIRTYGWQLLLMKDMPLASAASWLGLIAEGESLYPGWAAIFLGMVGGFLPFTVLPIYTNAERLDWSIVEAAQDLYASKWRLFVHAILPQTIPGLVAAVILTFIPAMGTFVVSDILGMRKYMLIGNKIEQSFMGSQNLPAGAALSLTLMLLTLIVIFSLRRYWQREEVQS